MEVLSIMRVIKTLRILCFSVIFFAGFSVLSVQALVLDWSGSYELEWNILQKGDFEQWGSSEMFHNLRLKPDIKAFDNVRVRSWFQLVPLGNSSEGSLRKKFLAQEGRLFGFGETADFSIPLLSVRDLYLEIAHDFGLFQTGWKPHHFGLGMYYNDSSVIFSPVYNKEGSSGFVSWRGFIGSSYYIQPMVHYIGKMAFNFFIQLGFTKDEYGVEAMYKTAPQNMVNESTPVESPSYFGVYGYYKMNPLVLRLEAGSTLSEEVYGGALEVAWQTPLKWLGVELNTGISTSNPDKKVFYFDPSFSSLLFSLISEYEDLKSTKPEYLSEYLQYSIHSSMYISPSVSFSILDSLSLKPVFSIHLSYPDMGVSLYHTELELKYHLAEGVVWNTSMGIIFPTEDHWHIGAISQVAITF